MPNLNQFDKDLYILPSQSFVYWIADMKILVFDCVFTFETYSTRVSTHNSTSPIRRTNILFILKRVYLKRMYSEFVFYVAERLKSIWRMDIGLPILNKIVS